MILSFKLLSLVATLQLVVAAEPRRELTETVSLSNGADLSVEVTSPTSGADIPVALGTCDVEVTVQATASVGEGTPDASYVYVIDESGSTSGIIGAIKTFFNQLTNSLLSNTSTKNIGVVTFDSTAEIRTGLTRTESTIDSAVNAASSGGQTDCRDGLDAARDLLTQASAGGTKIVIFAGDGNCNQGDEAAAADALANIGAVIQVLAIGNGVDCSDGSLGSLPRNGGSCIDISNVSQFPVSSLVGTKLIQGTAVGDTTTFQDFGFTDGSKSINFTGDKTYGKGVSQDACATARGDDVLAQQGPQDVTECVTFNVIDNQAPEINCPPNEDGHPNDTGLCSAVYTYSTPTGTDNCPGATTQQITGLSSGSVFDVGTTNNVFQVTDAEDAVAQCSFSVTVVDVEPPTITCPADVVVNNDQGQCSAVYTYVAPVGDDNCEGESTAQTTGLASGSVFPVASVTTNTFVVTDAVNLQATCDFSVTVQDTELPSATCAPGPNPAGEEPTADNQDGFFSLDGSDNCGVESIYVVDSVSGHHFGPFPAGTTFKYVQAPGAPIKEKDGNGSVEWKLTGNGDAYVLVTDIHGNQNTSDCLVPPPPARRLIRWH